MDKINIDGHYVNCVNVTQVRYMEIEHDETGELIRVEPEKMFVSAQVPQPLPSEEVDYKTDRIYLNLKMQQLPVVAANAVTVHKLQGKSVDNLVASEWTTRSRGWVYVMLSRIRTSAGLFTRRKLTREMCKPMENKCKQFLKQMEEKVPKNFTTDELTY